MKKRFAGIMFIALLLALASCVTACNGCKQKNRTLALVTEQSEYQVEFGDAFILPDVTCNGARVNVTYALKDEAGNDVSHSYGMFTPVVGTYTVTASASGYESVTFKVICRDTTPPEIAMSDDVRPVLTGFTTTLPTFVASDRSGIKDGSVKAELITPSGASTEYAGGESVTVTEVGLYNFRVTASDIYDNVAVADNKFAAQDGNISVSLTYGQMFNFDEDATKNLVLVDAADEGSAFDIVAVSDIKDGYTGEAYAKADGAEPFGKALAVSVGAQKTSAFLLSMPYNMIDDYAPVWESTWALKIRFATDGRFTRMNVYNIKTASRSIVREITPYDRDYQEQMTWYEAELRAPFFDLEDPQDIIYKLGFEIVNSSTRNITVYIDEIFFTEKPDYTPENGVVLNFSDGAQTLGFARDLAGYGSRGAKITYETDNIPAGAGAGVTGALKVSTLLSMQGTEIIFPKIYPLDYFDTITIRLYLSHVPTHLRLGFFDDKGQHQNMYLTPIRYGDTAHLNCVQGWKDYVFRGDQYNYMLTGNIVGVYMGVYEQRDKYFLERYPDFDPDTDTIDMYIAGITYTHTDKAELDAIKNGYMQDNAALGGKNVALFNSGAYEHFLSGSYVAKYEPEYAGSTGGAFVVTHGGAWQNGYLTFTPPATTPVSQIYGFKVRFKALGADPAQAAIYMLTTHRNDITVADKRYYWNLASSVEVLDVTDGWQTVLLKFNPDNAPDEALTSIVLLPTNASNTVIAWDYIVAIPYVDGGNITVQYKGGDLLSQYFSNEPFNWSMLSFSCAGYSAMTFDWQLKKDGEFVEKPSGNTALAAGSYELIVRGVQENASATGSVTFTVSDPAEVHDVTLTYDGSTTVEAFTVGDDLEFDKIAASSVTLDGKPDTQYTYELVLPTGSTVALTADYRLARSGDYTLRVTGKSRGFIGTAEITLHVNAAIQVDVVVTYDGETQTTLTLSDGLMLDGSLLSVSATAEGGSTTILDSEIRKTVTFDDTTVAFNIDTYTFTTYGKYEITFEVTKKGYEGSATLVVNVVKELTLVIKRGSENAADIRTTATTAYNLTQFSVTGDEGAETAWSIAFGSGTATALDMTATSYVFPQKGVYTVTVATTHDYIVGSASFTVTVEDLPFGEQDDETTIIADFANEGYDVVKDHSMATLTYVRENGKTVLRSFAGYGWDGTSTTFKYTLPQAISLQGKVFHIRYKVDASANCTMQLRFNRKKQEASEAFNGLIFATQADSDWTEKSFSYAEISALVTNYISDFNGEVTTLYFQHATANTTLYIEKIWLTDEEGLTDFPAGGVELTREQTYTKTTSGWDNVAPYSLNIASQEIHKNGSIQLRVKRTAVGSANDMRVYVGFDTGTLSTLYYTGSATTSDADYVVLTVKLDGTSFAGEEAKRDHYFASSDTVTVSQLKFRLFFNAGTSMTVDIDWVAYVPPAA